MAKLPDGWVFIPKPVKRTTIDIEKHELVMCRNCTNATILGTHIVLFLLMMTSGVDMGRSGNAVAD